MPATLNLDVITLLVGNHDTRIGGVCLMEAAAWFASEPHTDHPTCVTSVLARMGRTLNDNLPDERRQELKMLIPRLVGTAGSAGLDETRRFMALDWLVRTYLSEWLQAAGKQEQADAFKNLPPITSAPAAKQANAVAESVRDEADKARNDISFKALFDSCWSPAHCVSTDLDVPDGMELVLRYIAEDAIVACEPDTRTLVIDRLCTSAIALYTAMIAPA